MRVRTARRMLFAAVVAMAATVGSVRVGAAERNEGLELALKIESAITSVAERASESVVVITNMQTPRMRQRQEIPPEFRRFFGIPEAPRRRGPQHNTPHPAGMGSGVLIQADGYVVTNYHVIKDHDHLVVKLLDGRIFDSSKDEEQVKVIGTDKETDIAVLKLGGSKAGEFPHLKFADSAKIRVGQYAIAVGAPFNLDYSVTIGHVSQKGRHGMRMTNFENYIQTDASINPGNSGGPLLDIHGKVIGINQFIMTGGGMSRGNIGLGFAIPSNLAKRVSNDLIQNGQVARPFLGITMQELTPLLKKRYDVEQGVLVESVIEGQAAEKAGIKAGDVVTHVGDKAVKSPHDLLFAVLDYKPGDRIMLTVNRDGKVKQVAVMARDRNGNATAATGKGNQGTVEGLGVKLQPTDDGLVVAGIEDDSPATRAEPELRAGDIILLVNGIKVSTPKDVAKALDKTKNEVVLLYVDRPEQGKYLVGIPLAKDK